MSAPSKWHGNCSDGADQCISVLVSLSIKQNPINPSSTSKNIFLWPKYFWTNAQSETASTTHFKRLTSKTSLNSAFTTTVFLTKGSKSWWALICPIFVTWASETAKLRLTLLKYSEKELPNKWNIFQWPTTISSTPIELWKFFTAFWIRINSDGEN